MELLEIEKELKGDSKEEALAKYDGILLALAARLKKALRLGLSPDEFAKCEPLEEAITISRKLLRLQMKSPKPTTNDQRPTTNDQWPMT